MRNISIFLLFAIIASVIMALLGAPAADPVDDFIVDPDKCNKFGDYYNTNRIPCDWFFMKFG